MDTSGPEQEPRHATDQAPREPKYRRQKVKGRPDRAFVVLGAVRHCFGEQGTPESHARYNRIIGEWRMNGGELAPDPEHVTIVEMLARWWRHPEQHYRDAAGRPTTQQRNARYAVKWVPPGNSVDAVKDLLGSTT